MRADRVSVNAFAAAVEPRWKDAGVVEDHQIAGAQQFREVAEQTVRIGAVSPNVQHPGAVAGREGFLGDEFRGKVEVEVRNQHNFRL